MSNKEVSKITVNRERFNEAMQLRKTSISKLGTIPAIDRNEKAIRRYLNEGKRLSDLLDRIGKHLSVDPAYLSGDYNVGLEKQEDEVINSILKSQIKAERFP